MRGVFLLFSVLFLSLGCPDAGVGKLVEPEIVEPPTDPDEPPDENIDEIPLPPPRPPNPRNRDSDVDCDGIPDWEELEWGTNPQNRDSDGDGIWDGIELGRTSSPDPECEGHFPKHLSETGRTITDPRRVDTDCDGIADGYEDKNLNGRVDPGETDPSKADTDDDGLWDGVELGLMQGIWLRGGTFLPEHPDPLCAGRTKYAAVCTDPASRRLTLPTNPDTDGDGIPDGAEDANKNGCFEPGLGETDPGDANSPNPIDEPEVRDACSAENLVPIDIRSNFVAQIAMGLPMGFQNSYVDIQRGNTRGLMGFDTGRNVAFVAWQHPDAVADLAALRALAADHADDLGGTAAIGEFVSWDAPSGGANAVSAVFSVSGSMSPVGRANAIANSGLLGSTTGSGALTGGGAAGSTQYVRAQYVLRGDGTVVVVMAVALNNNSNPGENNMGYFGLMDVAGGAALARYFDRTVVQCERGVAANSAVDFLFVVDDSASMEDSQTRLAAVATAMAAALNNSTLDWRVAMVTSSYHSDSTYNYWDTTYSFWEFENRGVVRGFTRDISEFQAWLTRDSACQDNGRCSLIASEPMCNPGGGSHGGCWIGINGNPTEGMLGSARLALMDMTAPTAIDRIRFRPDADIVVVILTDTEDHTGGLNSAVSNREFNVANPSWENVPHFVDFFQGRNSSATADLPLTGTTSISPIRPGVTIPVHAVYCPNWLSNNACEDGNPTVPTSRIRDVVQASGGMLAPISDSAAIDNTLREIVNRTIGSAGVRAQKPFIGASLRVAIRNPIGACDGANVPRSRLNGFDYDGFERTVTFFGSCRPSGSSPVAISYRAWEASNRLPCEDDIHFDMNEPDYCKGRFSCDVLEDRCTCPELCGGCPSDTPDCNLNTCMCSGNFFR